LFLLTATSSAMRGGGQVECSLWEWRTNAPAPANESYYDSTINTSFLSESLRVLPLNCLRPTSYGTGMGDCGNRMRFFCTTTTMMKINMMITITPFGQLGMWLPSSGVDPRRTQINRVCFHRWRFGCMEMLRRLCMEIVY
jgi:hypothetical protein